MKKGQTLLEVLLAMTVLALVVVGLLQALNISAMSVYQVDTRATAINLARSQMEHVKSQPYQDPAVSETFADVYGIIPHPEGYTIALPEDGCEVLSAGSLQQITVNVSFSASESVVLVGYKAARSGSLVEKPKEDMRVTESLEVPILPDRDWFDEGWGYYYVFEVGDGPLSATWLFRSESDFNFSLEPVQLWIFSGIPDEVGDDGTGCGRVQLRPNTITSVPEVTHTQSSFNWAEGGMYILFTNPVDVTAGTYTVFFYNGDLTQYMFTQSASLNYYW